jgi:hypothetical protein
VLVWQPERAVVEAIMKAMAALLKNFTSDLKYRLFNDIYSLECR